MVTSPRTFTFDVATACTDGAVLLAQSYLITTGCPDYSGSITIPSCGGTYLAWTVGGSTAGNFQKDCLWINGVNVNASQPDRPAGTASGTIAIDGAGLLSGHTYPVALICRCGTSVGNSVWSFSITIHCC